MKKYLLVLCCFAFGGFANAQIVDYSTSGFSPLAPKKTLITQPVNDNYNNLNYNKVTQAEATILGQTYETQHITARLDRLEQIVFNRTYPSMTYEQRMDNIIVNYKNNVQRKFSYNGLSRLENKVFRRTYENDLPENRISRLEEQIMGTIQSGDLRNRYTDLERVVPAYERNSYTTSSMTPSYCSMPMMASGRSWRGMAGSLGNIILGGFGGGYPTGLSPQINSPYVNNYGPDYSNGYTSNRGWGYNNTRTGSGTGVTILD